MRLIDADAIHYCSYDLDNYHYFRAVDEDEIAEMPTIDAVPVVRCKECKYENKCNKHISTWEIGDDMEHYWADRPVEFCGYGERRENV